MSDIDFDELDRAVNGVIDKKPTAQPVTETSAVESNSVEALETFVNQEAKQVSERPAAPAARRSSGRFMDMVHPSSDMRSKPDNTAAVKGSIAETVSVANVETSQPPAWNEPLESPFLPDAKVEKRPLGGGEVLDESKEELLEVAEPQELLEAVTMPDPIDFAAAHAVTEEIESKLPEVVEEVEPEVTQQPEVAAEVMPIVETTTYPATEELAGPTSITPQYTEQPSSNQESGAIYDTEAYHQPVIKPVKKKSSLLTVVWILLLVILGAAAGWAVYTYILPML